MTDAVAEITAVVATYIEGLVEGDRAKIESVFHPKFSEIGHFEGDLLWNDREAFIGMCEEAAGDAPAGETFWAIRSLSIAGDIATVHVEDDWAGMRFDDMLTLLHHEGRWQIICKAFQVRG